MVALHVRDVTWAQWIKDPPGWWQPLKKDWPVRTSMKWVSAFQVLLTNVFWSIMIFKALPLWTRFVRETYRQAPAAADQEVRVGRRRIPGEPRLHLGHQPTEDRNSGLPVAEKTSETCRRPNPEHRLLGSGLGERASRSSLDRTGSSTLHLSTKLRVTGSSLA